jgi:hypothetical protein
MPDGFLSPLNVNLVQSETIGLDIMPDFISFLPLEGRGRLFSC